MPSLNTPVDQRPGEEWREVSGFAGYSVSSLGRVMRHAGSGRGITRDRLVLGQIGTTGYHVMALSRDGRSVMTKVHRLVAAAFVRPLTDGEVVNHIDGNKTNNVVSNLEITDHAGNVAHAVAHGLIRSGAQHGMAKLTDQQVRNIRAAFASGEQGASIAVRYGITRSYAYHLKQGRERAAA